CSGTWSGNYGRCRWWSGAPRRWSGNGPPAGEHCQLLILTLTTARTSDVGGEECAPDPQLVEGENTYAATPWARQGRPERAATGPASFRSETASVTARTRAQPRRGRDGRQRPLGEPARLAPHRRPQARGSSGAGARQGRHRTRDQLALAVRLLHRELEAQPGRGPVPDELQPGRHPASG